MKKKDIINEMVNIFYDKNKNIFDDSSKDIKLFDIYTGMASVLNRLIDLGMLPPEINRNLTKKEVEKYNKNISDPSNHLSTEDTIFVYEWEDDYEINN